MDETLKPSKKKHVGFDFEPQEGHVYVLVVLPERAVRTLSTSVVWVVKGSVANALDVKGVRARLDQLAHSNMAYSDPTYALALTNDGEKWMVHVVFKSGQLNISAMILVVEYRAEEIAQYFEAKLLDEIHKSQSAIKS